MQISGAGSASSGIQISFDSASKRAAASSERTLSNKVNYVYKEVVNLQNALESIHNPLRLQSQSNGTGSGQSGAEGISTMSKTKASRIADAIEKIADSLNAIFDDKKIQLEPDSPLEEFMNTLRTDVIAVFSSAFDSTSKQLTTDFGINFDFRDTAKRVMEFSSLDRNTFIKKLTKDGAEVNDLLFAKRSKDDDGLVEKLMESLEVMEGVLEDLNGTSGVFVDLKA